MIDELLKPHPILPYTPRIESPAEKAIRIAVEHSGLYGSDVAMLEYELLLKAGLVEEHPCMKGVKNESV